VLTPRGKFWGALAKSKKGLSHYAVRKIVEYIGPWNWGRQ